MKKIIVRWKKPEASGTGRQSRQMANGAHSGCCRQGGSPCSSKKFSR